MPIPYTISALIIEPNDQLRNPYRHLPDSVEAVRVTDIGIAIKKLRWRQFDLVLLSTSYTTLQQVEFLEVLKDSCRDDIIPLILVVDLENRLSVVPGTTWGGSMAIATSTTTASELQSMIYRLVL